MLNDSVCVYRFKNKVCCSVVKGNKYKKDYLLYVFLLFKEISL